MIRLGVSMAGGKRIMVSVTGSRKASRSVRHTASQLTTELYAELRRTAHFQLSQHQRHETLRPTALVNEVFLKFANDPDKLWDRTHFMITACKAMQQVIVDYARARLAHKRNLGQRPVALAADDDAQSPVSVNSDTELLLRRAVAVHHALDKLASQDSLAATIVRLRFFAGMKHATICSLLGVSESTAHRSFVYARAWLVRELADICP